MADETEGLDFFDSDIEEYTKKYGAGSSDSEEESFFVFVFEYFF